MGSTAYQEQLAAKRQRLQALFQGLNLPEWEIFQSAAEGFRMRAEFRIWHEGGNITYAMFEPGRKAGTASLIKLDTLPAADDSIRQLMPRLLAALSAEEILKNRLYQCEFLATLSGDMLITLIYHRPLCEQWEAAARRVQDALGIKIIGRSKKQKIVLQDDFVTERLQVHGKTFAYRQIEGGFTQPNAKICEKMLEWACSAADGIGGDLLELYCGNGNFTLPLAQHFRRVLATEVSKTSVAAAQWNIAENAADNIRIARLSAEEFTEAYAQARRFRRLQEQQIDLTEYDFSTIFVDPPRAGVDNETLQLAARFDNIIYISCNLETLRDNLAVLSQTHDIVRAALFDQFPFTPHIESGMLLKKKQG